MDPQPWICVLHILKDVSLERDRLLLYREEEVGILKHSTFLLTQENVLSCEMEQGSRVGKVNSLSPELDSCGFATQPATYYVIVGKLWPTLRQTRCLSFLICKMG